MQTRVISGTNKGIILSNPKTGTRPLTDRIKTSIFDLLTDRVHNSRILDLFAGGGNFGIEALSRGAQKSTFVDSSQEAINVIGANLQKTNLRKKSVLVPSDVKEYARHTREIFDLIMLDPPFDAHELDLDQFAHLLSEEGIIIYRLPSSSTFEHECSRLLKQIYSRKFGKSHVAFYQTA